MARIIEPFPCDHLTSRWDAIDNSTILASGLLSDSICSYRDDDQVTVKLRPAYKAAMN